MTEDDVKHFRQKHISLDYDGTYTEDPRGWRAVIRCLQSNGHKVSIVTARRREEDWDAEFTFLKDIYGVETFFTHGEPKRDWMNRRGIQIDIWIDDMPEMIT